MVDISSLLREMKKKDGETRLNKDILTPEEREIKLKRRFIAHLKGGSRRLGR